MNEEYKIASNPYNGDTEDHFDIMRIPEERGFVKSQGPKYIVVFRGNYSFDERYFRNNIEVFTRDKSGNLGISLEDAVIKGKILSEEGNKDLGIKPGLVILLKRYISKQEWETGIDNGLREIIFESKD